MKALMLCRLYGPHVGGVERHVAGLVTELKKRKYQITIITEQYDPLLPLIQYIGGARVVRIPHSVLFSKRKIWAFIKSQRDLFERADLIHIHDVFWWYLPLRFSLKKPVYITFHGYEGSGPPRWQAVTERKMAEKLCQGSICVGDFMRKWYHSKPTKIIYGAANCKHTPIPKNKSAVFLGRLEEDTGIMTYIKALQLIKPEIPLDIYGDGPQQAEMINQIKQKRLLAAYHGNTTEIEKVIRKSRYAFVSRYLAILEAMQTKRLVIAVYNNQIKKDYLTCHPQAEQMIIAGTATELAGKLMAITSDEEKVKVDKAYAWAKTQTWQKLADEYEGLWKIK